MRRFARELPRPAKAEGAVHRLRGLVIAGLTTAIIVLWASPAPAAQVFSQFDIIVRTHIHEQPAGEDQGFTRPATARITVKDLSRELTDGEIQLLEAEVPDPLNELCFSTKDGTCVTAEMEASLGQSASGVLAQFPDLEFGEVSAHIAVRRDGETRTLGLVAPVLLGSALFSRRRRRG